MHLKLHTHTYIYTSASYPDVTQQAMQMCSKILDRFCAVFVNSAFPLLFAVTCGDCLGDSPAPADSYFPRKSLLVLTLPLSWIRPSKEKAICARGCKDQRTVTKQKSNLLFSPAVAVAKSCEKLFTHIAMDVLKRNHSIIRAHRESFLFSLFM